MTSVAALLLRLTPSGPLRATSFLAILVFAVLFLATTGATASAPLAERLLSNQNAIWNPAVQEFDVLDDAARRALLPGLIAATRGTDGVAYERAVRAARVIERYGAAAIPAVTDLLAASEPGVRMNALNLLVRIKPTTDAAFAAVLAATADPVAHVRGAAYLALGATGSGRPGAVERLIDGLRDADPYQRGHAARALDKLGPQAAPAVPALVAVLTPAANMSSTVHQNLRHDVIKTLGQIGPAAAPAASALAAQLSDPVEYVRVAAVTALTAIGAPAVPALVTALESADPYVRQGAAEALGRIRPRTVETKAALMRRLDDPRDAVRAAAREALYAIEAGSDRRTPDPGLSWVGDAAVRDALLRSIAAEQRLQAARKIERARNQGRLRTRAEVEAPLGADGEYKFPATLQFAKNFPGENDRHLVATLHRGQDRPDVLRLWAERGGRHRLLKELRASPGISLYAEVSGFHYRGELFLYVPLFYTGTGAQHDNNIFWIAPDDSVHPVPMESGPAWYRPRLARGEGVWKGEGNVLTDAQRSFVFDIWKESDGNCCPGAGKVVGEYQMTGDKRYDAAARRYTHDYRLVVKSAQRLPPDPR